MKDLWEVLKRNPISAFAVLCVAFIGGFLAYMTHWETTILASPDWCNRILNSEKLAESTRLDAALACLGIQKIQIEALATNSHIDHSSLSFALIVLVAVVIAGARLAFKLSKSGLEGNMDRHGALPVTVVNPPEEPVQTQETGQAPAAIDVTPKPDYNGPAMPEPPKGK